MVPVAFGGAMLAAIALALVGLGQAAPLGPHLLGPEPATLSVSAAPRSSDHLSAGWKTTAAGPDSLEDRVQGDKADSGIKDLLESLFRQTIYHRIENLLLDPEPARAPLPQAQQPPYHSGRPSGNTSVKRDIVDSAFRNYHKQKMLLRVQAEQERLSLSGGPFVEPEAGSTSQKVPANPVDDAPTGTPTQAQEAEAVAEVVAEALAEAAAEAPVKAEDDSHTEAPPEYYYDDPHGEDITSMAGFWIREPLPVREPISMATSKFDTTEPSSSWTHQSPDTTEGGKSEPTDFWTENYQLSDLFTNEELS